MGRRGRGNNNIAFRKMFLKVYWTHLSVTAEPIHRKCSYTDLSQKEPYGKQLAKTYRSDMKVHFIYFIFSRWPSSRTSACTSLRILECLDGNRSMNTADSKCWWGALLLVLCLEEEGLHIVIKEEWESQIIKGTEEADLAVWFVAAYFWTVWAGRSKVISLTFLRAYYVTQTCYLLAQLY